jgi:hypothetical protein
MMEPTQEELLAERMKNEPDPARLIIGLRDTGYDFYTAAADIIDNSIAAGAENINIDVVLTTDGRKFVYFGDDGHGMDEDGLFNAMKYGAQIREDLASLGKFGLGLKTASSSICLKYSIISRNDVNQPLKKRTWDLDHVADINKWEMLDEAITEDEEAAFDELCEEVGTLVVWAKCDRLLSKAYEEPGGVKEQTAIKYRRKKLGEHCALIFHKYLNPNDTNHSTVNMAINGVEVNHWNPFYPEKAEQVLPDHLTSLPVQLEDGSVENATVKAWILPHSKDMTKEENDTFAKISNRGQGFYIHREGRVIHYGGYLGLWRADDPHWSLFRIEFDFDHKLDEAFHVDVKKSQILLDPALEEGLKELLSPAYKEADNRYRRKQAKKVAGGVSHGDANNTVGSTTNTSKARVEDVDPEKGTATVDNNRGKGITILTPVANDVDPKKLYIHPVDNIANGYLWEPCLNSAGEADHSTGVHINMQHDFYTKVYSQMNSGLSVEGLDLLLWALAAAEHKNTDQELSNIWEDIRDEVSSNLRKLLRKVDLPTG